MCYNIASAVTNEFVLNYVDYKQTRIGAWP